MKKYVVMGVATAVIAGVLGGCGSGGEEKDQSFGPASWEQYRFDTSNNALFENGDTRTPAEMYKTDNEVRASPVVAGDNLYVGTHDSGTLYSFDVFSGKENWHAELPNWIHEDSIYAEDTVYVGYGNRLFEDALHPEFRGTNNSGVAAFDATTGDEIWQYETPGEVMPAPAYRKGTVYFVTGDSKLYAVDAKTGKLDWDLELPGWASMPAPRIVDDVLYVGALDYLVAIDLKEQEIKWKKDGLGSVTDVPPAIGGDGVVMVTGAKMNPRLDKDELYKKYGDNMPNLSFTMTEEDQAKHGVEEANYHFLYAFDAESGNLLWEDLMGTGPDQDVPIPHTHTSGAVTVVEGTAYVGSPYTNSMMAYGIASGNKIWETEAESAIKGAPAVKDEFVYFGDADGILYKVQASDGEIAEQKEFDGAFAPGGPILINDILFAGNQDHNVYTWNLK